MAVIAVWKCDRDGSMFADKKEAEEHDKMLELAENITALIEQQLEGVDEAQSEAIGLLLAKHREVLAKACKGKPELLLEATAETESDSSSSQEDTKVTAIAGSR